MLSEVADMIKKKWGSRYDKKKSEVAEDLENEGRHKGAGNYKTEIF